MNNKSLLLERILLNMIYDSKKTLSENKIILNESKPKKTKFYGPKSHNPNKKVQYIIYGTIMSNVSANLEKFGYKLSSSSWEYTEGYKLSKFKTENSIADCCLERYPWLGHKDYKSYRKKKCEEFGGSFHWDEDRCSKNMGECKKWDDECEKNYHTNLEILEKERASHCKGKIQDNPLIMNLPFQIDLQGYPIKYYYVEGFIEPFKTENYNGTYQIYMELEGNDCTFGDFTYYPVVDGKIWRGHVSLPPYEIPPKKPEPVIKKVDRVVDSGKTLEEKKQWCKLKGNVWDEVLGVCTNAKVSLKAKQSSGSKSKSVGIIKNNINSEFKAKEITFQLSGGGL